MLPTSPLDSSWPITNSSLHFSDFMGITSLQCFIALPPTYAYLNYILVSSVFESYINGIIQYVLEGQGQNYLQLQQIMSNCNVRCFNFCPSIPCMVVISICISLISDEVEHILLCLLVICISPFVQFMLKPFAHFATQFLFLSQFVGVS